MFWNVSQCFVLICNPSDDVVRSGNLKRVISVLRTVIYRWTLYYYGYSRAKHCLRHVSIDWISYMLARSVHFVTRVCIHVCALKQICAKIETNTTIIVSDIAFISSCLWTCTGALFHWLSAMEHELIATDVTSHNVPVPLRSTNKSR